MKIAFASINGKYTDCPFRTSSSFSIFSFQTSGYKWLESRTLAAENSDRGEEIQLTQRVALIRDCSLLLACEIGFDSERLLKQAGILALAVQPETVIMAHLERMRLLLTERPPIWLIRAMRRADVERREDET